MTTNANEPVIGGDPKDDEVDTEPYEGAPDFDDAPWSRTNADGVQDDEEA